MKSFIFFTLLCLLGLAAARTSVDNDVSITCEDVLAEKICADLRNAAKKFKLEVDLIDKLVKEALEKDLRKVSEIIAYVREHIIEAAKDIHCTNLLPEWVCTKIAEVAAKLKVKMSEVEQVMKEIIAKGITKIKEIIEELKKHFFPHLEKLVLEESLEAITCEDVLSEKVCEELREIAEKLKLGAAIVDQMIREALEKGMRKASEIIAYIRDKMVAVSKITCEDVISKNICDKIKEVADKLKIKFATVIKVIKQAISKGLTTIKDIIRLTSRHFFPSIGRRT
jgi:propanediol dehydratase small subunit